MYYKRNGKIIAVKEKYKPRTGYPTHNINHFRRERTEMETIKELTNTLLTRCRVFNTESESLREAYKWAVPEFRELKIKEERQQIKEKTLRELDLLKADLPELKMALRIKKERSLIPDGSNRVTEINNALLFLNSKPTPKQFQKELNTAIAGGMKTYAGYLLKWYADNGFSASEIKGSEDINNLIEQQRASFYVDNGVTEIHMEIMDAEKLERGINTFENIVKSGKFDRVVLSEFPAKDAYDLERDLKYVAENEDIPLDEKIGLKRSLINNNPHITGGVKARF